MTLTTTTATVTALLLIPIAVSMSNHGTPSVTSTGKTRSQIVTAIDQDPASTPILLAQADGTIEEETLESEAGLIEGLAASGISRVETSGEPVDVDSAEQRVQDVERRSWHHKRQSENEQRIEEALHAETQLEFVDTPLSEAVEYISQMHNIPILIKEELLNDFGVPMDQPVNLSISGITLESALDIILEPLQLEYMTQNEVMMITTVDDADGDLETRVYKLPASHTFSPAFSPDQLIQLVQSSVKGNWEKEDGIGGHITAISNGLVIRQTQRAHREIEALFEQLEAHAAADGEE